MAWESRNGSGAYYTRSRKIGGRVVREYCGSGEIGALYEHMDKVDRAERERVRWERQKERERAQEFDTILGGYCELVESSMRDTLQRAGYHQHHRGDWRRKRGNQENA